MITCDLTEHLTAVLHVRSHLLEMFLVGKRGKRAGLRDAANPKLRGNDAPIRRGM